jgi:hypothetical protein
MKDKPGNAKKSRTKGASKENTKPTTDAGATAAIEEDEILAKTSRWTLQMGYEVRDPAWP